MTDRVGPSTIEIDTATRPALTTYDRRLVRRRPRLLTADLMQGRDFRKMVLRDNFPLPADELREGYCIGKDISYWQIGLASFLEVMNVMQRYDFQPRSILDFGSASGRVTRHFRNQLDDVVVWAADINPLHIRWLAKHIPRNPRGIVVDQLPGLPIADNSLDLICAFSVFTHIDEMEMSWLAELRRVLKRGGYCYCTVHNDETWQALARLSSENRLVKSMLKTPRFSLEQLQEPIPEGKTVYHFSNSGVYRSQVFHANEYLHRVWGQFFQIVEILPPHGHQHQSVVLLKKP